MTRPLALLALSLLSACSAGDVSSLKGASVPVPASQTWAIGVSGCVKASDCTALRNALVFSLTSAKLLQQALPAGTPAPLSLEVAVIHFRSVSPGERSRYALLAGHNEVTALVTLKAGGTVLRSFKVTAQDGGYLSDDTIQDIYRQFDADVVAAIKD